MKSVWKGVREELTLSSLELLHMKPGGVHPGHLPPSPGFRHRVLISGTIFLCVSLLITTYFKRRRKPALSKPFLKDFGSISLRLYNSRTIVPALQIGMIWIFFLTSFRLSWKLALSFVLQQQKWEPWRKHSASREKIWDPGINPLYGSLSSVTEKSVHFK